MKSCPNCSYPNPDNLTSCFRCQTPLDQGQVPAAGAPAPAVLLLIPPSVSRRLPAMVRNELTKLSAQKQEEFLEEYERKAKSIGWAYALWFLGLHYAYLRDWGMLLLYWLTCGGLFLWAMADLMRIPHLVTDHNKDLATDVLRDLKALSA